MSQSPSDYSSPQISRSQENWNELITEAARRACDYLDGLGGRSVFPKQADLARLASFDEPLPAEPHRSDSKHWRCSIPPALRLL